MRKKGRIQQWNDVKGFGFIQPFDSKKNIFIHITDIQHRRTPKAGEVITYTLSTDKNNRLCAIDAALAGDKRIIKIAKSISYPIIIFSLSYLLIYLVLTLINKAPIELFAYLLGVSFITYTIFAFDKFKAKRGGLRTPEKTLLMFSLIGGWPGALIAQQTQRHKSSKKSFIGSLWFMILLSISFFVWLIGPDGKIQLDQILSYH